MRRSFEPFAICALLASTVLAGQVPITSPTNKHNLSLSGPGPVRASSVEQICVFCHTPHNSNPATPRWNQTLSSGVTYTSYSSSTMAAAVGLPTGSSKLCLSCHDGTVAIGKTVSEGQIAMTGVDAQGKLTGTSMLGLNLADDHPVSFAPVTGSQIVAPPARDAVKLDANGMLQCSSCHDPHRQEVDPVVKKFLVKNNRASALCLTCHQKTYWLTNPSSHQVSTRAYTTVEGAHTGYTTVATNGCESCHKPHTAPASTRVLKALEEATCGTCHGTSGVASKNIAAEFNKLYRHPTYDRTPSVHDAAESPGSPSDRLPEVLSTAERHAECADCHNPHASYAAPATAPKASGKLSGAWGIDSNGSRVEPSGTPPSVREYEICYKCHADSVNKPQSPLAGGGPYPPYPNRVALQFNKRLQLDPANPSYHPVEAAGKSTDVPSLKAPWTTSSSIIYCTDCHGNDTGPQAAPTPGTGPDGVHGSNNKHLLVARYDMDNQKNDPESAAVYALCYKCHDRTSILGNVTFREHNKHVVGAAVPCATCHDPHGISASQGNSINNSRLINFDKRWVTPDSQGRLRFEDLGYRTGRCYLTCHGKTHSPLSY